MIYIKTVAITIALISLMLGWFYAIAKTSTFVSFGLAFSPLVGLLLYTVYVKLKAHERKKS